MIDEQHKHSSAGPGESVHSEPVHSEPHLGHGGTSFEGTDASAGMVIGSLATIGGTLVIVFVLVIGVQKLLERNNPPGTLPSPLAPARIVPQNPVLQIRPWEELPEVRAREEQILNSYGKDADGHVHIPIAQAMNAVVPRLNVAPGAPQGITTPGGEGREFSGSVNAMPPAYQRPQIKGEIRKNAQK
ncbi:MAG: hypothetical protein JO091_06870 [Acidobacteriaceae bacterium]|nr:hypothetical protein [Acidobacteriaceae bacterium]